MKIVKKKCSCGRSFKTWEGKQFIVSSLCLDCCFKNMFSVTFSTPPPRPLAKVFNMADYRKTV